MHFKRTRSERLSREILWTKLLKSWKQHTTNLTINFESEVFLYTNKQHWEPPWNV